MTIWCHGRVRASSSVVFGIPSSTNLRRPLQWAQGRDEVSTRARGSNLDANFVDPQSLHCSFFTISTPSTGNYILVYTGWSTIYLPSYHLRIWLNRRYRIWDQSNYLPKMQTTNKYLRAETGWQGRVRHVFRIFYIIYNTIVYIESFCMYGKRVKHPPTNSYPNIWRNKKKAPSCFVRVGGAHWSRVVIMPEIRIHHSRNGVTLPTHAQYFESTFEAWTSPYMLVCASVRVNDTPISIKTENSLIYLYL